MLFSRVYHALEQAPDLIQSFDLNATWEHAHDEEQLKRILVILRHVLECRLDRDSHEEGRVGSLVVIMD